MHIHKKMFFLLASSLVLVLSSLSIVAQEVVVLELIMNANAFSDEQILAFEEANPDIDLVRQPLVVDQNRGGDFELALASGTAPDILRIDGGIFQGLLARDLVLDMTEYVEQSSLINSEDFSSSVSYYQVDGGLYALPKDYSLPFALYINTAAFEAAGIPVPDDTEPLTFAELAELAVALTIVEDGEVVQLGFHTGGGTNSIDGLLHLIMLQRGEVLFNEDYSAINLVNNPAAVEALQYLYDLALAQAIQTPLNPMNPPVYRTGQAAMLLNGYWFYANIAEDMPVFEHVKLLPAPIWDEDSLRISPASRPAAMAIYSGTEHPDEAFRFMEYYIAGEAAIDRAQRGWGLPTLRSLESELPRDTAIQQQLLDVTLADIEYSTQRLPLYPYADIDRAVRDSWNNNLELALLGVITFDELVANMEEEINLAILDASIRVD